MNPNEKKKLEGFVKEIDKCMLRMDAERDLIKDILNRAKDDLDVKPKVVRRLANIYHKNSVAEERSETEEIFDMYEQLFESSVVVDN